MILYASGGDPGDANGALVDIDIKARRALSCVAWITPSKATDKNPDRFPTVWTWFDGEDPIAELCRPEDAAWTALSALDDHDQTRSRLGERVGAVEAVGHYPTKEGASKANTMPPSKLILTAESAGRVVQVVQGLCSGDVLRPTATAWRKAIGVETKDAKRAAMQARAMVGDTTAKVRMPVLLRGLPAVLAKIDHVADAALIALWASITSRAAAGRMA